MHILATLYNKYTLLMLNYWLIVCTCYKIWPFFCVYHHLYHYQAVRTGRHMVPIQGCAGKKCKSKKKGKLFGHIDIIQTPHWLLLCVTAWLSPWMGSGFASSAFTSIGGGGVCTGKTQSFCHFTSLRCSTEGALESSPHCGVWAPRVHLLRRCQEEAGLARGIFSRAKCGSVSFHNVHSLLFLPSEPAFKTPLQQG